MTRTAVLAAGSLIVGVGVLIVLWRDLRFGAEQRDRPTVHHVDVYGQAGPSWWRLVAEAVLPVAAVAALMWWAWSVL